MAFSPVPAQHDIAIQNSNTGQIDFLHFTGTQLTGSQTESYIGPGWKIVANGDFNFDGHPDLVAQNTTTGQLDFLFLNASGVLTGSAATTISLPTVHGVGFFGSPASGQSGPTLVSQTSNGSIDLLGFNFTGGGANLIASDLIPNTAGLAPVVGVGGGASAFESFFNVGTGAETNIIIQLADGTLDALGFSGNFGSSSVAFIASLVLPGTAGSPAVGAVNQDFDNSGLYDLNAFAFINGGALSNVHETVQMVGATAAGQIDHLFFDSGYNDAPNEGAQIGSLAENFSLSSGWQIVDGGMVAHNDFFPIT